MMFRPTRLLLRSSVRLASSKAGLGTVAFLGLGKMGQGMATNLVKAGADVAVFDVSDEAVAELTAVGARGTESGAAAVRDADYVVTMLPNGAIARAVYCGDGGLLAAIGSDATVLDCSTIDAATAREIGAEAAARGIKFMDAPVSGGVAAAAGGNLAFMCGGEADSFEKAKKVLSPMGQKIFHAGPSGAGQVAKACNNMLLAIHMIGTAEAIEMGVRSGLDATVVSEIMTASSGRNWSLEVYNPYPGVMPGAPASKGYAPGFTCDLMVKDLRLAAETAKDVSFANPMGTLARELYEAHQAAGSGAKDFSSILEKLKA